MFAALLQSVRGRGSRVLHASNRCLVAATTPASTRFVAATLADLPRGTGALSAGNALLRQQLVVLRRSVKGVPCTPTARALQGVLASRVRAGRHALLIVQPETRLRGHRQGFRLSGRRTSRTAAAPVRRTVTAPTIALIQEMAAANRLWGAERIRGELLKLGVRVAKTTVQRYMRQARPPRSAGQTWATFLCTHAMDSGACDFLPVTALLVRQLYAVFIVELATRRVVHVGVTRHPTDAWVAPQLREATPFGQHPTYLSGDNDSKWGPQVARVAEDSGITLLRTAYRAPLMHAVCERSLGSVRRECLDHLLILSETHLRRALRAYVSYFNGERPHQGLAQRRPVPRETAPASPVPAGQVVAVPVLGGLHHAYRRVA
jgi:transposase InsO family protein